MIDNRKLILVIGVFLFIVGVVMMMATLYQEEIPMEPEIPHMEIPTARFEWRTRNQDVTNVGILFVCVGASLSLLAAFTIVWFTETPAEP